MICDFKASDCISVIRRSTPDDALCVMMISDEVIPLLGCLSLIAYSLLVIDYQWQQVQGTIPARYVSHDSNSITNLSVVLIIIISSRFSQPFNSPLMGQLTEEPEQSSSTSTQNSGAALLPQFTLSSQSESAALATISEEDEEDVPISFQSAKGLCQTFLHSYS
jgi:hypothetical protein